MAAPHPHHARLRQPASSLALAGIGIPLLVAALVSGCETNDACEWRNDCPIPISSEGGQPNTSGPAQGGGGGVGGVADGGGGALCRTHSDCTDPMNAQCDAGGACIPCGTSPHCAGVSGGLNVCDDGTCVECKRGEEAACTQPETCNLNDDTCVDAGFNDVPNCMPCTNDAQCVSGHRCIAMDFAGRPHGHYCLEATSNCEEPYSVGMVRSSLNGVPATNYCGINESLTSCEAVRAMVADWSCSGTDGMCSPTASAPEEPVPGAVCENVGSLGARCTYACDGAVQCPASSPQNTCGSGNQTPPGWCGG